MIGINIIRNLVKLLKKWKLLKLSHRYTQIVQVIAELGHREILKNIK
jgi:hypothetical protein